MTKTNYAKSLSLDGSLSMLREKEPDYEKVCKLSRRCFDKLLALFPDGENNKVYIDIAGEFGESFFAGVDCSFNAGVRYGLELAKQPVRVFVKTLKNKPVEPVRIVVTTEPTKGG